MSWGKGGWWVDGDGRLTVEGGTAVEAYDAVGDGGIFGKCRGEVAGEPIIAAY